MTNLRTKEIALGKAKSKPDPREEAPAIQAEILEIQGHMCAQVGCGNQSQLWSEDCCLLQQFGMLIMSVSTWKLLA